MRILLLCHAFNSLSQRLFVELTGWGHEVAVEFDINDATTLEAVALAKPDLILAPFLKRAIPEAVWRSHPCWIVHPGPIGDRGPSALDWAVLNGEKEWAVTVLEAEAEMDAGPVRASRRFPMRPGTKASLYRHEVADAAVAAVREALDSRQGVRPADGITRPFLRQIDRAIDWTRDDTATVLRKIWSADGHPGLLDHIHGQPVYLFDATASPGEGPPGTVLGTDGTAILRATVDGAVRIGHLRAQGDLTLKLPATQVLNLPAGPGGGEVSYEEHGAVGLLHFPFLNGAMSAEQCDSLRRAFLTATQRPTTAIVLTGGPDFWSNGIHLGAIEAADSPADESWRTINAMDDLCLAILTCTSHVTVAAMQGNAGAGGVFMALAADYVFARQGIVLNPHYRGMGNLYGSEYWTYLLPQRVGAERSDQIAHSCLPIGTDTAQQWGLIDEAEDGDVVAHAIAKAPTLTKRRTPPDRPLADYRAKELERMRLNFYGFDPSYHVARFNFIHKIPKSRTPSWLARHRG